MEAGSLNLAVVNNLPSTDGHPPDNVAISHWGLCASCTNDALLVPIDTNASVISAVQAVTCRLKNKTLLPSHDQIGPTNVTDLNHWPCMHCRSNMAQLHNNKPGFIGNVAETLMRPGFGLSTQGRKRQMALVLNCCHLLSWSKHSQSSAK